jgi:hypothetical protein
VGWLDSLIDFKSIKFRPKKSNMLFKVVKMGVGHVGYHWEIWMMASLKAGPIGDAGW